MTNEVYAVIGGFLVTNISIVLTAIFYGGKAVWYASKIDSKISEMEKDLNAAHQLIREMKK